jgi:catechol 2,3-dioxygenase-like lactoylglutathione lyase family enzyme
VPSATILAAEPQLLTCDMAAGLAFYTGRLGFDLVFAHGEPPFYAQVGRGGARLNLRLVPPPIRRPVETDMLAATLTLDNAQALYGEFQTAGVEFAQPLRTEPWGARTFMVRDPDGNLLLFAGSA